MLIGISVLIPNKECNLYTFDRHGQKETSFKENDFTLLYRVLYQYVPVSDILPYSQVWQVTHVPKSKKYQS